MANSGAPVECDEPHAYVRYIMDGSTKVVPVSWFKEPVDLTKVDRLHQYLVFFTPSDEETPASLKTKLGDREIPEFENEQVLDEFDGDDPSGYYRANVLKTGVSMADLKDKINVGRTRIPSKRLIRDSSFDLSAPNKRKSTQHGKGQTKPSTSKKPGQHLAQKSPSSAVQKPVAPSKQLSDSVLLKNRLVALAKMSGDKPKNRSPVKRLLSPSKASKKPEMSKMPNKMDGPSAGTPSSEISAESHSSALYGENNDKSLRDFCFRKSGKPHLSESSEEDDAFVEMSDHQKVLKELAKKEAEIEALKKRSQQLFFSRILPAAYPKEDVKLPETEAPMSEESEIVEEVADGRSGDKNVEEGKKEDKAKQDESKKEDKTEKVDEEKKTDKDKPNDGCDSRRPHDDNEDGTLTELGEEIRKIFLKQNVAVTNAHIKDLTKLGPGKALDKKFTKLAAELMWGWEYLVNHSTGGRNNPKNPGAIPRPALDPDGLKAVRDILIKRVGKEDIRETYEVRCALPTVKRYIGERIQSLINSSLRKERRSLQPEKA